MYLILIFYLQSKQKTRAHSFPSMNRQKRQFIHEMCEHFGCESVAYDAEPNRNVVATADKEKVNKLLQTVIILIQCCLILVIVNSQ